MVHKFARFWQLLAAEQRLMLLIASMLPLLEVALRLFGFNTVYTTLHRFHPQHSTTTSTAAVSKPTTVIAHLNRRLRQVSRWHPWPGRCLAQSLMLWWLLRQRGIATDLRFGQRTENGRFAAHAWVEYEGQPINAGKDVSQLFFPFAEAIRPSSSFRSKR